MNQMREKAMRKMRLDRLLSRSGVSRRDAAALVKAGRVTVNGQTARDAGVQLDLDTDSVTLNFAGDYYMNRGVDSKAIGQIFGLQANKPTAVSGNNMAYVVNVVETRDGQATDNLMLEKNYLQNAVLGRERNENTLLSYLINQTKVLDNRVRFYQK